MKTLCDEKGIEPIFTHTVSVKRKLLKMFENESEFQDKLHVRSVANFVCRNLKTMIFKVLLKKPEDMLVKVRYFDKDTALMS